MGGSKIRDLYDYTPEELRLIGFWEAEVADNVDPDKEGKIKVIIPELFDEEPIEDVIPIFNTYGHAIPKVGMFVYVMFQYLQQDLPYYFGGWFPGEKLLPGQEMREDQQIYSVPDKDGNPLLTIVHNETVEFRVSLGKSGSYLQYDEATREINIFSDQVANSAPINLNGKFPVSGLPAARQFDKVTVLNPMSGTPMEGFIMEGSKRVYMSNDKSVY